MTRHHDLRLVVAAAATTFACAAHASCDAPRGAIAQGATLGELRPVVSWASVAEATAYRVKLLSRIPNGRVVGSYDTVTKSTSFLPPAPLAEERAKVVVHVSAICGAEASAETVASFDIDATTGCRLGEVQAKRQGDRVMLEWQAVPGAKTYELRANALDDGGLIAAAEVRGTNAALAVKGKAAVVSVRPACAGGPGEALYRVVAAD